jgi:hypothetical protein
MWTQTAQNKKEECYPPKCYINLIIYVEQHKLGI